MIHFAPLSRPFKHRRETFAVLLWILFIPILLAIFAYLILLSEYNFYIVCYLIYIKTDTSPETGSRKSMWLRKLPIWQWMADYFPMELIKTTELEPTKNYLFAHGIISLGAFTTFGTEARDITRLFPGLNIRVLTLATNFNMPFIWDSVVPGASIMIVPGGAAESLYAFPGTFDLVLKKRLGFIKVALRNGASLVPVLAFGENDIWNQVENPKGSMIRKVQTFIQRISTVAPPLLMGRGIFQYSFGLMPHRRPVRVVVGSPIDCPRVENPSLEMLREYQQRYVVELERIFDDYKDKFSPNRRSDLHFVE